VAATLSQLQSSRTVVAASQGDLAALPAVPAR